MDSKIPATPLPFLHLLNALKHLPRTGWLRTIDHPESVASHSFRLALLGGFAPPPLDNMKCVFIGLCHDMAESIVGDIPTYAGVPKEEKHMLEASGFQCIASLIKESNPKFARDVMDAWLDYEEGRTPEGKWMKEMDKFECLVQALDYEKQTFGEKDLEEFQGLKAKVTSPQGLEWLAALDKERQQFFSGRTHRSSALFVSGTGDLPGYLSSRMAKERGYEHVALGDVLERKSLDPAYPHAEYIRNCLDNGFVVFPGLSVDLLRQEINHAMEKNNSWVLISGFPATKAELKEFEREVQKGNPVLLLRGEDGQAGLRRELGDYIRQSGGNFRELDTRSAGNKEELFSLVKQTVEEMLSKEGNMK